MPTAFWSACYRNHTDMALALLAKSDVNREENALSPLFMSVVNSNVVLIKALLRAGAEDDSDVMYMALKLGNDLVIHLLLDRGMWPTRDAFLLRMSPAVRLKMECIEDYKWLAAMQRVDLIITGVLLGQSPPFRQWRKHLSEDSFLQIRDWVRATLQHTASCYAALFFTCCDASIRRYTWTESPVSELLVRYLVPARAQTRRVLRDMRAF